MSRRALVHVDGIPVVVPIPSWLTTEVGIDISTRFGVLRREAERIVAAEADLCHLCRLPHEGGRQDRTVPFPHDCAPAVKS